MARRQGREAAVPAERRGRAELAGVRREGRRLYWGIALASVFVNLLMLTGPLYMLQVYDRVLSSRSVETLLALTLLVVFLYAVMGVLDLARSRLAGRAAARFQARLDGRAFGAVLARAEAGGADPGQAPAAALRDVEAVRALIASPVLLAAFDLPFVPLFAAGIFLFHPWLGLLALGGAAVLVALALANQWTSRAPQQEAAAAMGRAERWSSEIAAGAETVRALGMRGSALARWRRARGEALSRSVQAADLTSGFTVATRTFRLFLQSAMLGLGALLVLRGELTAGAMIASSILLGRALAPIELGVGQWPLVQRAARSWGSLARLLGQDVPPAARTVLPRPEARLTAENLVVAPPGTAAATLKRISFELPPGRALGVIGPSGAGKTTLARAVAGLWPAAGGEVRLGGAALSHYAPDTLGALIGYLPQQVRLFEGTVAQNIARLGEPDDAAVVAAARTAGAHDMILHLPDGYETEVGEGGAGLSGGQLQRIGLARAFYGDPVLLVLDEPNSNLDATGSAALTAAIREAKAAGRSVIVIAHRPAAIEACDLLLMLDGGVQRAFGPTAQVLAQVTANHRELRAVAPSPAPGPTPVEVVR